MHISFLKNKKKKKLKCGNGIAEIGGPISAMPLPHFNFFFFFLSEIIRAPYFYNIFTTNFKRQVVIVGLKK